VTHKLIQFDFSAQGPARLRREVHAAYECLEAGVGTQAVEVRINFEVHYAIVTLVVLFFKPFQRSNSITEGSTSGCEIIGWDVPLLGLGLE
jgi:hypothetical protein